MHADFTRQVQDIVAKYRVGVEVDEQLLRLDLRVVVKVLDGARVVARRGFTPGERPAPLVIAILDWIEATARCVVAERARLTDARTRRTMNLWP